MARSERLLTLLQSLRGRRQPVSAARLASELGVSELTAYRDLATLRGQGADIQGSPGQGFILGSDHFLPPLMLTPEEANAVSLGLHFVIQRGGTELVLAAQLAAAKIGAVLPAGVEQSTRLNGLTVAPAGNADPALGRIRDAMSRERKLRLEYRDGDDRPTARTVWPIAVGFFDGVEIVAAWCELRNDFRHFRLDRLRRVEVTDDRFPKPHRLLLAQWRRRNPEVRF